MRSKVTRWGALSLIIAVSLSFGAPAQATPSTPNDALFDKQWNLQMIGAPAAWQVATGAGITVAIVDTGVDLNHEDLKDKIVGHVNCIGVGGVPGRTCDDSGNAGQDDNGHGTHVAGIAAAETDNQTGVAGTAPDASILAVKVLDSTGSGSPDDVAAGIKYAADQGAAVINLSLGNVSESIFGSSFQEALDYAFAKGAVPVIAAGNNFVLPSGSARNAIVVGALNRQGVKATYSNIGSAQWVIMAPGGDFGETDSSCESSPISVLSTYPGKYACLAGTSMAAPHVSGAVAVLRSNALSQQEAVDKVLATARALPTTSLDGAGALDLAAAVGLPPTPPPNDGPDTTTTSNPLGTGSSGGAGSNSSTPSGDLGGSTPTSPPVAVPATQRAAAPEGKVIARAPGNTDDGLSAGIVTIAVVMAAGVSAATALMFLRGKSWTRRTPKLGG